MNCPKCGCETAEGVKFCGACGALIAAAPMGDGVQPPTPSAQIPKAPIRFGGQQSGNAPQGGNAPLQVAPPQGGNAPLQYPPQQGGPTPQQYPPQQGGPAPQQYPTQQGGPAPRQYPPPQGNAPAAAAKRPLNKAQVIVSVLALLNVIFVPIYDVWGGLFPSDVNRTFWDFITGKCSSAQWVFMFMLAIFVCSLLMFIFSVARLTLPARLSAAAGILWVGFRLFQYFDQFDFDFDYIFGDFDNISFSIGFWIALLLFLVMLFLPSKKRTVIG